MDLKFNQSQVNDLKAMLAETPSDQKLIDLIARLESYGPLTVEAFAKEHCPELLESPFKNEEAFKALLTYQVEFFTRQTGYAGFANHTRKLIELNSKLQLHPEDIKSTFLHECAHVIADRKWHTNCRHNRRWKWVARILGDSGKRYHSFPYITRTRRAKKHHYRCGCAAGHSTTRPLKYEGHTHRCKACNHYLAKVKEEDQ